MHSLHEYGGLGPPFDDVARGIADVGSGVGSVDVCIVIVVAHFGLLGPRPVGCEDLHQ